jgi:hypothetical protein
VSELPSALSAEYGTIAKWAFFPSCQAWGYRPAECSALDILGGGWIGALALSHQEFNGGNGRRGVPQGGVISPLLCNLNLTEVDRMLERAKEATRPRKVPLTSSMRVSPMMVILRLKTLKGLTPYEHICKVWTTQPNRLRLNSLHHTVGLNT